MQQTQPRLGCSRARRAALADGTTTRTTRRSGPVCVAPAGYRPGVDGLTGLGIVGQAAGCEGHSRAARPRRASRSPSRSATESQGSPTARALGNMTSFLTDPSVKLRARRVPKTLRNSRGRNSARVIAFHGTCTVRGSRTSSRVGAREPDQSAADRPPCRTAASRWPARSGCLLCASGELRTDLRRRRGAHATSSRCSAAPQNRGSRLPGQPRSPARTAPTSRMMLESIWAELRDPSGPAPSTGALGSGVRLAARRCRTSW